MGYGSPVDLRRSESRVDVLFEVQCCFGGSAADSSVANLRWKERLAFLCSIHKISLAGTDVDLSRPS